MSNFGVNFNFDFGNLKLDKLFEDANKSGKANLSSNQQDITSNYQANSANSYGGTNSSDVETMDLSANVKNNSGANNVDTNNVSNSSPSTSQTDSNVGNTNVDISQSTNANNTPNGNAMNQENVSVTENNNVNVNTNSNSGSTVTNSNSNQTNISMNDNNSNNSSSNNTGIDIDNKNVDVSANNSNSNVDVNSNNNMNVNTNSNSGTNHGGNTNTSMNVNTNGNSSDNSSVDVSLDLDTNNNESSSSGLDIKDGKVYVTSTDMEGNPISVEIDIDDYINNLKSFGFNDTDIKRITDGKITPEELMDEIQKDVDTTRKQQVMESSYLKACGLNFNNMDELKKAISDSETELRQLTEERNKADNKELDDIMIIISRLKQGETFENIINSEIVCWKYIDENGNICYTETDPYQFGLTYDSNGNPYQYEPLTFIDMYGESDYYRELEGILTASTVTSLFGEKTDTIHRWEFTEEQEKYFDEIAKKYSDNAEKRDNTLKELDSKIKELQSQKASYEYIYEYINKEISYYLEYVDAYTSKEDFSSNVDFNNSCLEKVEEIKSKNSEINLVSYQAGPPVEYINNKEDLVNILACMINGEGDVSNGFLRSGNNIIQLSSTDDMLTHYQKWLPFVTEDEVQIFNYIYNTEGIDAAYNYLENISDELDNRWLANKTQEDQEFASEHPVLASIGSIVVTPIEGISAACYSMNSYLTGEKIRRADVYSAGDVWRSQVSQDIAENYGEGWAFVYNTGMSMADSATLIALSAATGGVATPILSATLMGSRAYVSTLNDALDRGLSDGAAVGLAFTSAVVETAMESYSVGHLLNLEEHLGKNTIKLAGKIANNIENETVANLVTKGFYLGANALSQGLAEGEEEFATEILNYVADIFIAKDLSNYSESINQYLSNGYTEEQALISTMIDFSGQAFQAFLGGFASGICFGTFGGVSSTIKTSNGISMQMYNDLYGKTSAQQFTSALEINQQQLEDYSNAFKSMKNGESLTQEQMELLNNGTIEMQSTSNLKQQMKQNLKDLGISIKNIFSQNTINNTTLQENSETQNIASDMMKVYDLVVEQGIIENLISKAKGENGKVAGVELFRMLGYDAKPTVVQSEEFDILTKISQYGTLVRGISGENSQLYVDQFINGEMYVGGTHAAIKGTGIYTGFGLSAEQIGEKYATRAGTETGGSVIEMILNQEAKVIEYSDILSEQNQVLDNLSLEFSKYNPAIKNFDTLLANLSSITDSLDLQKAKFVTNFLMDTGYYAALRGYDAIVDSSVNYLTVLNRGKLTVQDVQNDSKSSTFINENGLLDSKLLPLSDIEEIEIKQKSLLDNTADFKLGSLFNKVNSKIENRVSSQMSNFTREQIQWINQVNDMIKHGQSLSINLKNTKSITSQMLAQISDLSKLSIRMDLALSDFNGNYMNKYNKEKYLKRVTYTGTETYFILQKIEQLENMVDKSLPVTQRAKRIYDIISSEIPVMRNYSKSDNHYLVSQSLRGIVSNNIIGESGLICAGYASLFRELCTRCGIQCDYIRGKAVLDLLTGKSGGHAWNVFIDEHGNPIAVDVTWNASGGGNWFGGSEEFQKTHIPDNDEKFKNYLLPANLSYSKNNIDLVANQNSNNVSKEKIIENILSTMVQKYGDGSGLDSLIQYARTGDKTKITRQNGARDSLQYLTQDDIIQYINFKNDTINNIIYAMDQKYGKGSGIDALRDYVVNKNEKIITRQNGARDSLQKLTIAEIKEYIKLYF